MLRERDVTPREYCIDCRLSNYECEYTSICTPYVKYGQTFVEQEFFSRVINSESVGGLPDASQRTETPNRVSCRNPWGGPPVSWDRPGNPPPREEFYDPRDGRWKPRPTEMRPY